MISAGTVLNPIDFEECLCCEEELPPWEPPITTTTAEEKKGPSVVLSPDGREAFLLDLSLDSVWLDLFHPVPAKRYRLDYNIARYGPVSAYLFPATLRSALMDALHSATATVESLKPEITLDPSGGSVPPLLDQLHHQLYEPDKLRAISTVDGGYSWKTQLDGIYNEGAKGFGGLFRFALGSIVRKLEADAQTNAGLTSTLLIPASWSDTLLIVNPKSSDSLSLRRFRTLGMLFGCCLRLHDASLDLALHPMVWNVLLYGSDCYTWQDGGRQGTYTLVSHSCYHGKVYYFKFSP
jgi:hypothetical protein